jgi:hypothetical protein
MRASCETCISYASSDVRQKSIRGIRVIRGSFSVMRDLLELAEKSVRKGGVGWRSTNVLSESNARRGAALRFGNIARNSPVNRAQ